MKTFIQHFKELVESRNNTDAAHWIFIELGSAFLFSMGLASIIGYAAHVDSMHSGWINNSPDISLPTAVYITITGILIFLNHRWK